MKSIGFAIILFYVSIQTISAEETLHGFDEMVLRIQDTPKKDIRELNGEAFEFSYGESGDYKLILEPAANFGIVKTGNNTFIATIKNAETLTVRDGPFINLKPVKWHISVAGGSAFNFQIEGVNECAFTFTFNQVGGEILNLGNINSPWEPSYKVSRPNIIDKIEVSGQSLLVLRKEGRNEDVSVQLLVTNQTTKSQVKSDFIEVPKCGRYATKSDRILQEMSPTSCVKLLYEGGSSSSLVERVEGKKKRHHKRRVTKTFANSCALPIKCKYKSVTAIGDSRDMMIQGAYEEAEVYSTTFTMSGLSEYKLEYHLDFMGPSKAHDVMSDNLVSPRDPLSTDYPVRLFGGEFSCLWD